jgi:predicted transcriptional regulator YdeE
MKTVTQEKPICVVGLEVRTSNETALTDIPAHWARFYQSGILNQIASKTSGTVYAVYTNFENPGKNNKGVYSFILGAEVPDAKHIPTGLVSAVIPPSKRRVFEVEKGQPQKVGEKWQEIWALGDQGKTFVCDFERYLESGEIEIHVGIA